MSCPPRRISEVCLSCHVGVMPLPELSLPHSTADQWCAPRFRGQNDEHARLILAAYLSVSLAWRRRGGEESLKGPPDRRQLALVWGRDMATHVRGERMRHLTGGLVFMRCACHVTGACVVGGGLLRFRGRHRAVTFFLHWSSLQEQHGW